MEYTIDHNLFGNNVSVPVGAILPYVGNLQSLPANWELCDGRLINNPNCAFHGRNLPNLTDNRFLMGVAAAQGVNGVGGSNDIANDGNHSHTGITGLHAGYMQGEINFDRGRGRQDQFQPRYTISPDGTHNHGGENRPLYCGVYFIIRLY